MFVVFALIQLFPRNSATQVAVFRNSNSCSSFRTRVFIRYGVDSLLHLLFRFRTHFTLILVSSAEALLDRGRPCRRLFVLKFVATRRCLKVARVSRDAFQGG